MRLLYASAHLIRWVVENGLGPNALDRERVDAFLEERSACGYADNPSPADLQPIIDFLKRPRVAALFRPSKRKPSKLTRLLEAYREYLLQERAITTGTAAAYVTVGANFLRGRFGEHRLELPRLSSGDVTSFILGESGRWSVGYTKLKVTALRSLLRYLHVRGELSHNLVAAVPPVAGWRLSGLPKGLPPDAIRRLLRGCDRRTASGRRAFALLLLLVRLGLRAREAAALTLDDVDWNRGELVVRGKNGQEDRLPLPQDVGRGLASYVRRAREAARDRKLFVALKAPFKGLTACAITMIVRRIGHQAGLGPIGAHRLRHSAATQMLRRGASLPDVARVLRHRCIDTTAIYAKVDHLALRELARPWPGAPR